MNEPVSPRRLPGPVVALSATLGLLTLISRLFLLDRPSIPLFDEMFYVHDAAEMLRSGVEAGRPAHPPLGKWMIAGGIDLLGFVPLGWRLAPLLVGAAVVSMVVAMVFRVTGSAKLAFVGAVVAATDGIAFTMGRIAMLDGLSAGWSTAVVLGLVTAVRRSDEPVTMRRLTWFVALMMGAGMATKWSVAPLGLVAVTTLAVLRFRTPGTRSRWRELGATAVVMAAVPALVYLASFAPWLANYPSTNQAIVACAGSDEECSPGLADRGSALVEHHERVLDFHQDLEPTNRYVDAGWKWSLQLRPTGLLVKRCEPEYRVDNERSDGLCDGSTGVFRMLAVGNPLIWWFGTWATLAVLLSVPFVARRQRQGRGPADPRAYWAVVVVAASSATFWLPWIVPGGRPGYSFYAAPIVACMATVLVSLLRWLEPKWRTMGGRVVMAVAVAGFALTYPVLTGVELSPDTADTLLWLDGWNP